MTFSSFCRTSLLATLVLLSGCLTSATSGVSGGGESSVVASPSPAPTTDMAAEKPTGFLGSNTESSDLSECDMDPTLAKCKFSDAPAASRTAMCLLGYSSVRFVFNFIAPGAIVAQNCFFTGQDEGTGYLTDLSNIDSYDTVAGWRYLDTCVRLDREGSVPGGYTIANGAPDDVGYRGFYFKKTEDAANLANETMFESVDEFQGMMKDLIAKQVTIRPIVKASKGSIAIPPKESCDAPDAPPPPAPAQIVIPLFFPKSVP